MSDPQGRAIWPHGCWGRTPGQPCPAPTAEHPWHGGCAPPAGGAPVLCRPGRHWGHQYRTLGNPCGQGGEGLWCAAGGRGRLGDYLAGSPRLFVRPVLVVADVPPLDLKGVGRGAAASEGARHLHVLAGLGRHVVRGLGEQGCRGHSGGVGACGHGATEWRGDGPTKLLAGPVPATQGWPQPSPSPSPRAAQPHGTARSGPGQPRAVGAPPADPVPTVPSCPGAGAGPHAPARGSK